MIDPCQLFSSPFRRLPFEISISQSARTSSLWTARFLPVLSEITYIAFCFISTISFDIFISIVSIVFNLLAISVRSFHTVSKSGTVVGIVIPPLDSDWISLIQSCHPINLKDVVNKICFSYALCIMAYLYMGIERYIRYI